MGGDEQVSVGWGSLAGTKVLKVDFGRVLDVEGATTAAEKMVAMALGAKEPVIIVWECSRMESYTAKAFDVWRDHLVRIREAVAAVHCITRSTFIRGGAVVLGLALRRPVKTWSSEGEVKL